MAGLLCSFWSGSSYFRWITQAKSLYPQTQSSQHQWETDRAAWDWWSPAVLYSHQRSKTLVWGLLEPQPHRRAPAPALTWAESEEQEKWPRLHGLVAGWRPVRLTGTLWMDTRLLEGLESELAEPSFCFTPPVRGGDSWAAQSLRAQGWGR